jgi:hypothetical protein
MPHPQSIVCNSRVAAFAMRDCVGQSERSYRMRFFFLIPKLTPDATKSNSYCIRSEFRSRANGRQLLHGETSRMHSSAVAKLEPSGLNGAKAHSIDD